MKKNKLNILDCTLRDGGYYNNWYFEKNLINEYLKVMDIIKVDYVEIGFRFIDKVRTKGPTAYSEESFLNSLKIHIEIEQLNYLLLLKAEYASHQLFLHIHVILILSF